MNRLKEKLLDLKKINNYRFDYLLEDGQTISFTMSQYKFPHLLGLHKLVDIPLIVSFNDLNNKVVSTSFLLSKIKQENGLTDEIVRSSSHFHEIEERYDSISSEQILSLSFTDVIIDFDSAKAHSKLASDFIFFEEKNGQYYILGIKNIGKVYVPETYFTVKNNQYIAGQKSIKVKRIRIYDSKNEIILEELL